MASNRHSVLLALLLARGQTPVQDIADTLGASVATVRRDLIELEQLGRVERLHGAARIAVAARKEAAFVAREQENLDAKRAIAEVAASQVLQPGATVFLDAGTTVLQLARHIANFDRRTTVFTNSLIVAQELAQHSHIELTLIGGRIRPENMSMVGPLTCKMLDSLRVDQLFLGATAIDHNGLLSSFDPDEAAVNESMIKCAEQTIVLADHSKFLRRATHNVSQLSAGQTLVCNAEPEQEFQELATAIGFNILYASDKGPNNGN